MRSIFTPTVLATINGQKRGFIYLTKGGNVFYFTYSFSFFNHCVTLEIVVGCWPDGYRTTQPFGNDIKALRNNTWQRFCMNEIWKESEPFL